MIPTYLDHLVHLEEDRQIRIKSFETKGYTKMWSIAKADYEIEEERQNAIKNLIPLRELNPKD